MLFARTLRLHLAILLALYTVHARAVPYPAAIDQGYIALYNLDFPAAHTAFESYMKTHPDDPLPVVSDAAAFLFSEFDRLHVIDVELFADQSRFDHRSKLTPDPTVRQAFDARTAKAAQLADAALVRNPNDIDALYSKVCIAGMRSDYALLIEKRDLAALNLSKEASALSKRALAADPTLYDAYLASGVENYMLSLKPAPMRFFLGLTGAGTNKEEGIRLLRITAAKGHYLAPFARMMLAVADLRDNKPAEARATLIALSKEFPKNTLYQREIARIPNEPRLLLVCHSLFVIPQRSGGICFSDCHLLVRVPHLRRSLIAHKVSGSRQSQEPKGQPHTPPRMMRT